MFLWLCGRHDKAREYIDRMLKMSPSSKDGLALRGWIDLTSGRETLMKKSVKYFDEALSGLVINQSLLESIPLLQLFTYANQHHCTCKCLRLLKEIHIHRFQFNYIHANTILLCHLLVLESTCVAAN